MRLFILLLVICFGKVVAEFGIKSSWSPHCNPTLKLYDNQSTTWYNSDSKALFEIEKRIKYEDRYLLLYREKMGYPIYLYAGVELIQREGNSSQLLIHQLPDYMDYTR